MAADALKCKECHTDYPLDARYVCERCFGPLEVAYTSRDAAVDVAALRRRIQAGPQTIWRYADFLPLERPARRATRSLPTGCTPLVRADRLAERLGLARCGSRTTPPTRRTPSRTASSSVALARAQELGFQVARLRLDRQPRRTRSPPTPPPPGWSPTSSSRPTSRSRRSSPPASTARTLVAVRGNYDDVNRLCTELSGEHELGVRERQPAPVLRRGLEDDRLRDRRAARLGAAGPRRRARSPRARCSRRSPRASRSGSSSASSSGARADDERRPGRRLLAGRHGLRRRARRLPPGASRTRSPSRSRSATRPTGRTRSSWRAAPAAAIDAVTDDEIRDGIRLLAETTGIFTETAGGVTTAVLAKLAERGDIGPDERVVLVITGDGLKTLDVVRGTFETLRDRAVARRVRGRARRGGRDGGGLMAVAGEDPDAAARRHRRRAGDRGRRRHRRRGARRAVRAASASCATGSADDGDLRRFVNVYVGGEDIRFLDGLETRRRRRRRGHDPARGRRRLSGEAARTRKRRRFPSGRAGKPTT